MQKVLDKIGISLSFICLIHCLIIPILLIFFPIVNSISFISDEQFHWILFTLILPVAIISLFIGCMKHRNFWILLPSGLGILLLILGVVFHDIEKVSTVLGGIMIAVSHIANYKLCHLDCHEVK